MTKTTKQTAKINKSEKPLNGALNDDLLDSGVFNSPVQEVFSPELQKLLEQF
jgi:hypothetical protein